MGCIEYLQCDQCHDRMSEAPGLATVRNDTVELQTVEGLQENRTLFTARTNMGK